jgi:hypothetical protein
MGIYLTGDPGAIAPEPVTESGKELGPAHLPNLVAVLAVEMQYKMKTVVRSIAQVCFLELCFRYRDCITEVIYNIK